MKSKHFPQNTEYTVPKGKLHEEETLSIINEGAVATTALNNKDVIKNSFEKNNTNYSYADKFSLKSADEENTNNVYDELLKEVFTNYPGNTNNQTKDENNVRSVSENLKNNIAKENIDDQPNGYSNISSTSNKQINNLKKELKENVSGKSDSERRLENDVKLHHNSATENNEVIQNVNERQNIGNERIQISNERERRVRNRRENVPSNRSMGVGQLLVIILFYEDSEYLLFLFVE